MNCPSDQGHPQADTHPPLWLAGRDEVVRRAAPEDWRSGPPDYALTDEVVPRERLTRHEAGSLEQVVEDLVRVFEMEASHKHDPATWVSTVTGRFRNRINGGPWTDEQDLARVGTYNAFIGDTPYYSASSETFESSHAIFHTAMPGGFFWEVLEVFSGPPAITFTWRHWGRFDGPYRGQEPTGELIEMFGMTLARVSAELKLEEVEHFYDQTQMLATLAGGRTADQQARGCPVAH